MEDQKDGRVMKTMMVAVDTTPSACAYGGTRWLCSVMATGSRSGCAWSAVPAFGGEPAACSLWGRAYVRTCVRAFMHAGGARVWDLERGGQGQQGQQGFARCGSGSGSIPDPLPSHPELGWTGLRFSHGSAQAMPSAQPVSPQLAQPASERKPREARRKAPGCLRPSAPPSHPRHYCKCATAQLAQLAQLPPLGSAFRRRQVCIPKISPILLASSSSQPRLCAFAPRVSSRRPRPTTYPCPAATMLVFPYRAMPTSAVQWSVGLPAGRWVAGCRCPRKRD